VIRARSISIRSAIVAASLALSCGVLDIARAQEEEKTYTLSFKVPDGGTLTYHSQTTENVVDHTVSEPGADGKQEPGSGKFETEQTLVHEYRPFDEETIAIRTTIKNFQLTIDDKKIDHLPEGSDLWRKLSIKGYRKQLNKKATDFDKVDFVLPFEPVKIGEEWLYTAPPTDDLPVYLTTTYKIREVKKMDGKLVAVIDGITHADAIAPIQDLRVKVSGDSRVIFAIEGGHVLQTNYQIEMLTRPQKNPALKYIKQVKTSMELVE